ncbi:carboxypeptidase B-like [Episyrphus balteatus]|uniref:carboxypeptidase B-like n=1 Tax=Episyrphus balteatus TaxID=286459 RepID=UPI0024869275|nr:carboxypeptidase B-like [Episyrphus balteatus]
MEVKIFLSLLASCCLAVVNAELEGSKIFDVTPSNVFQQQILEKLAQSGIYDFFLLPRALNITSRVMVNPKDQLDFDRVLTKNSINFKIVNEDVSKSINLERSQQNIMSRAINRGISFRSFERFEKINAYLEELAARFPDRVKVTLIGKTYEGRLMKTITISNGDKRANKKVIWVDGGIHAREWIAPAAALYVINQLVENFAANKDLLATYDWVVLPVANPDGYEYTHTTSRMWRKTRKPSGNSCYGTDPNRNFGFHWGELGASNLPCDDTFRGPTAFSEPETQIMRNELLKLNGRAKFYLTIHAYGNYLLYPWGWTSGLPSNVADIDEVARAGAKAIKMATGTRYTVGSSTNVLYEASGGSDDWALGVAGIPISITMELPAGGSGFNPSPQYIDPFVSEAWIGIKAMAQRVISKY